MRGNRRVGQGVPGFPEGLWALRLMARSLKWSVETTWLGVTEAGSLMRRARRLGEVFSPQLRCPRGHEVPAYGVFECACGAPVEGWVFRSCVVCGESAGWTPCPECGLPVRNPLRG